MSILVEKRDGDIEDFDVNKIANSIMNAAIEVGGEDFEIANELAYEVLDILESNGIEQVTAEDIHDIVEKTLIENGHAQTAKAYILKGADRNRMREMDTALMRSFEEITFTDPSVSEIKRENANIDSLTSMGTMLKYGSEAAKRFNLLYLMSKDIADAHRNGDIHIHDLDFLSLTETCVAENTEVNIRYNNEEFDISIRDLYYNIVKDITKRADVEVDRVYDTTDMELYIVSNCKYTKVKNIIAHSSDDKRVVRVELTSGDYLDVTDNHKITIKTNDGVIKDERVKYLTLSDRVSVGDGTQFISIKSISEIEYTGLVYDLETEDHHFTANDINVHNCCQIPLDKLFKGGFNTGHGFLREPGNIRTAGALAAIAIQSNQNDQHKRVA